MEVSQVLASYWTQRRAQEEQAETAIRQALQLSLTPRTDLQRRELAERAISLAGEIQRQWTVGEVRTAVIAVTVSRNLRKHLKSRENAAFQAFVGNLSRRKKGNRAAGAKLRRIFARKLTFQANSWYRRLEIALLQDRWSEIEQKAALCIGKVAFSVCKIRTKRLKSSWERLKAPKTTTKAWKLAKIANQRNNRELWIAFKLISKEIKGGYVRKCDFGLKIGRILSKFLAGRVQFARIALWRVTACRHLCYFLSFKRSESLRKALNRFPLRPTHPQSRYILYVIRGLQAFLGLSKPFFRFISAGKLAFRNLLQSPYFRLQLSSLLQMAADKLLSKAQKYRLYHKDRALAAIQAGRREIRPCGRLFQALGRGYSGFVMGGKLAAVRAMRRLRGEKQIKEAVEGELAAVMREKSASKQRKSVRFEALKQLKQRQIDANKAQKALILKRISGCILSRIISKSLQSRLRTLQKAAFSPAPILTPLQFQSLLRRPFRLRAKSVLCALRTVQRVKAKAAGRLQGLVTVLDAKTGKAKAKAYFRLFRFAYMTASINTAGKANRQLAALALFNGIGRKSRELRRKGYLKLQLNRLKPRSLMRTVLPLLRFPTLAAFRWIRIQAIFTKFALVTRKNRYFALNTALKAIKRCEKAAKMRTNWGQFAAKRLQSSLLRSVAVIWRQILTLAGKRMKGQRLNAVLGAVRSRIMTVVTRELLNISQKRGKDQKIALNALFPTSNRVKKRITLLYWRQKGKMLQNTGILVIKFAQKLAKSLKTVKTSQLTLSFSRISSKSDHRKRLPIYISRLVVRKRLAAKAAAWACLRCSRRELATASVQQLGAALHIVKEVCRLRSRFQCISARFPFRLFARYMARRRAAKSLFAGLKRCFLKVQREDWNCILTTEIGLCRQKRAIYGLFRILVELPDRIKSCHLTSTFRTLFSEVARKKEISAALSRLLQSFKAGQQRTTLQTAVSMWKLQVPLPLSLPLRLNSAITALSRSSSYRLSFQAFECIYTKSQGKEIKHALLLCRKAAQRADSLRTVKSFSFDQTQTADCFTLPNPSPTHSRSNSMAFTPESKRFRPIQDLQTSPQPLKRSPAAPLRHFEAGVKQIGGSWEPMPLYSSPYYPFQSFASMVQEKGKQGDRVN